MAYLENIANLLRSEGFAPLTVVAGNGSPAELLKTNRKTGIYVLAFQDESAYVGKSNNVVRRYSEHNRRFSEIPYISFKRFRQSALDTAERDLIRKFEAVGIPLHNIALTSENRTVSNPEKSISRGFSGVGSSSETLSWLDGNELPRSKD